MLEEDIDRICADYLRRFPAERPVVDDLRRLIDEGANVTSRKEARGHVTCGGIVIGADGKLLMIHHRALDRWLFPGGHLEEQDASLRDAALREIAEETGLHPQNLRKLGGHFDRIPIHIDCHPIPANPAKQEPEHRHFDFRFVFRAQPQAFAPQEEEVWGCAWVALDQAPEPIRERLREL